MCTVIMNTIHYHMERIEMEENVLKMLYVVVKCHIFKSYFKKKPNSYMRKNSMLFSHKGTPTIYTLLHTHRYCDELK